MEFVNGRLFAFPFFSRRKSVKNFYNYQPESLEFQLKDLIKRQKRINNLTPVYYRDTQQKLHCKWVNSL